MLPEAPRRLAEIFDLARELPVVDRAIYLDRECAGEPELRRQVEELLAHDQPEDDLLERPAWDGIATSGPTALKGRFGHPSAWKNCWVRAI